MANPVLINDLRRSIFRRKPVHAVAFMAIAIYLLTIIAATAMELGQTRQMRDMPLLNLLDLLLPVVVPAFAAGSFAREHEHRTWDDLQLTCLGSWEIIRGKFLACLLPTVVAIIVMFPPFAMLLMLQGVSWSLDFGPWIIIVLIKFLISIFFYISLVMVCSYYLDSGRTALIASYVLLGGYAFANYLVWMVAAPAFYSMFIGGEANAGLKFMLHENSSDHPGRDFSLNPVEIVVCVQAALFGILALIFLRSRMGKRG